MCFGIIITGDNMDTFLTILFIIIVLILILLISYIILYNRFNDKIIRINEAENRIDNNLRDKYDTLNRVVTLIKSQMKLKDDDFKDLLKLKSRKLSNFEFDRTLVKIHNEFISIYEKNKELRNSDEIYKAYKQLELIDEELVTLRNYYNGNIASYNKMIKKIPTLFIAKIKKYNERPFYDLKNQNDDDYEDFKL